MVVSAGYFEIVTAFRRSLTALAVTEICVEKLSSLFSISGITGDVKSKSSSGPGYLFSIRRRSRTNQAVPGGGLSETVPHLMFNRQGTSMGGGSLPPCTCFRGTVCARLKRLFGRDTFPWLWTRPRPANQFIPRSNEAVVWALARLIHSSCPFGSKDHKLQEFVGPQSSAGHTWKWAVGVRMSFGFIHATTLMSFHLSFKGRTRAPAEPL